MATKTSLDFRPKIGHATAVPQLLQCNIQLDYTCIIGFFMVFSLGSSWGIVTRIILWVVSGSCTGHITWVVTGLSLG